MPAWSPGPDPYEVLGISREARSHDISRAYRSLARRLHPDSRPVGSAAADQFHAATAAYELLSDPHRKAAYDQRTRHRLDGPAAYRARATFPPSPGAEVRPGPVHIQPLPDQLQAPYDDEGDWLAGLLQLIRDQARDRRHWTW